MRNLFICSFIFIHLWRC